MGKYKTFDPNAEIIGQAMLSFVECSNREAIMPFLEKHGLSNIEPDQWYPVSRWLDVLNDVAEQRSGMDAVFDFVSVGMKTAETAVYPPPFLALPFEEAMFLSNEGYQMNHRNGDAGEYIVEKSADKHLKVTVRTPYPSDLTYGLLYGQARRFLPPGTSFTVQYDADVLLPEQGGSNTVIHIQWE
jgi:hypothetical protein